MSVSFAGKVALLLRKSLKPFPWGGLENSNWGPLVAVLGGAAYLQSTDPGDSTAVGAQLLDTLSKYAAELGVTLPQFSL